MSTKLFKISLEVTELNPEVYKSLDLILIKSEPSVNNWLDIILEGTKENLITFLAEYMDEGEEYFDQNQISSLGNREYTTPDGDYRYAYIPEDIDLSEYVDLLDEAPKYTKVRSAFIHNDYVAHLKKELQMVPSADDQMRFFINLREGHCQFLSEKHPDYQTIVLWVDEKGTAEHILWKILNKGTHMPRKGLHYLLDYNCGGCLNEERVDMANLIVFG